MKLTPLQQKFIDRELKDGDFVAFPIGVFKGDEYKKWLKERRAKQRRKNE